MAQHYFPFSEFWWFYLGFVIFVLLALAIDMGLLHGKSHKMSFREAGFFTILWVSLALLFNFGFYIYCRHHFSQGQFASLPGFDGDRVSLQLAMEFLTGYVIEYSLSIDNLFVFVLVFKYFRVNPAHQHRILIYGIIGALAMRAIFIAIGSELMQIHFVVMLFGGILIFSGVRMAMDSGEEMNLENNFVIRMLRKFVPLTPEIQGDRFFIKSGTKWLGTPLFVALMVIEFTDLIFAFDSVPAIFGITHEPLIVFTSNIFAILGLRSLFFVLGNMMDRFHYLKYGLAVILIFVGLKMLWLDTLFVDKFPTSYSLGVIGLCLAISVLASILFPRRADHSGT